MEKELLQAGSVMPSENEEISNETAENTAEEGLSAMSKQDRIVAKRLREIAMQKNMYKARAEELEKQLAKLQKEQNSANGAEVFAEEQASQPMLATEDDSADTLPEKVEAKQKASGIELVFAQDLAAIKSAYPFETADSIRELPNVRKFAALRDAGLDAVEAYRIANTRETERVEGAYRPDGRQHLQSLQAKPTAKSTQLIPESELPIWRSAFPRMSDRELLALYNKNK